MKIKKSILTTKYTRLWDDIEKPTIIGRICNWFQYQYFNLTNFHGMMINYRFVTKEDELLETFEHAGVQCQIVERYAAPLGHDIIWFKTKTDYVTAKLALGNFFVEPDIDAKDELDRMLTAQVRKAIDKQILKKIKKTI